MVEAIALRPFEDVVWISHASVDLDLWADGWRWRAGPTSRCRSRTSRRCRCRARARSTTLAGLADVDVASLPRFRCVVTAKVAGVDAVVSNTGWSKEAGFELYPLGTGRALELWDAIVEAGEPHGLLVTGPVIRRAVEQGITDVQYRANSDMDPIEAGWGELLDLEGRDFVGREALLRGPRREGPARRTVGLVLNGAPVPMMEEFWPVEVDGGRGRRGALGGVVVRARPQHRDRAGATRPPRTTRRSSSRRRTARGPGASTRSRSWAS